MSELIEQLQTQVENPWCQNRFPEGVFRDQKFGVGGRSAGALGQAHFQHCHFLFDRSRIGIEDSAFEYCQFDGILSKGCRLSGLTIKESKLLLALRDNTIWENCVLQYVEWGCPILSNGFERREILGSFDRVEIVSSKFSDLCFYSARFRETVFANVKIEKTNIAKVVFRDCKFVDTTFVSSNFEDVRFINCTFKNVRFINQRLKETSFQDCTFEGCEGSVKSRGNWFLFMDFVEKSRALESTVIRTRSGKLSPNSGFDYCPQIGYEELQESAL